MKFECINLSCQITKEGRLKNFRFTSKPTIDERTKCPKCKSWCHALGYSLKDSYIRKIDIMVTKVNKCPLTEIQYHDLETKKIIDLKDIIKALEIEMGYLHES